MKTKKMKKPDETRDETPAPKFVYLATLWRKYSGSGHGQEKEERNGPVGKAFETNRFQKDGPAEQPEPRDFSAPKRKPACYAKFGPFFIT
jgi:hypothetical protein